MKSALQILGAFLSFFFILFGTYFMGLQLISRPFDPRFPSWNVYYIDFQNPHVFQIGCVMVSAGLTFLWFQRRK